MENLPNDSNIATLICFVCAHPSLVDTNLSATFNQQYRRLQFYMCPCCLFEYGVDDFGWTFIEYRKDWLESGLPFEGSLEREEWTFEKLIEQLSNLSNCDFSIFNRSSPFWYKDVVAKNTDWTASFDYQKIKEHWDKARK